MSCKDCLHVEVCEKHCEDQYAAGCCICTMRTCNYKYELNVENDCPQFTDKSRLVELPCKIGDTVWCIRNFHGHKHAQGGTVSEMYFARDMKLHIGVKYVGRGFWGENIFATREEAEAALRKEKENEADRRRQA